MTSVNRYFGETREKEVAVRLVILADEGTDYRYTLRENEEIERIMPGPYPHVVYVITRTVPPTVDAV